MYTATMRYRIKPGKQEEFVRLWSEQVLSKANGQPGLHRMMLLESAGTVMALGSWEDKSYAEAFMQTGVFKLLMDQVESWLTEPPQPELWEMEHYL